MALCWVAEKGAMLYADFPLEPTFQVQGWELLALTLKLIVLGFIFYI